MSGPRNTRAPRREEALSNAGAYISDIHLHACQSCTKGRFLTLPNLEAYFYFETGSRCLFLIVDTWMPATVSRTMSALTVQSDEILMRKGCIGGNDTPLEASSSESSYRE